MTVIGDDQEPHPGCLAARVEVAQEGIDHAVEAPHPLGAVQVPLLEAIERIELEDLERGLRRAQPREQTRRMQRAAEHVARALAADDVQHRGHAADAVQGLAPLSSPLVLRAGQDEAAAAARRNRRQIIGWAQRVERALHAGHDAVGQPIDPSRALAGDGRCSQADAPYAVHGRIDAAHERRKQLVARQVRTWLPRAGREHLRHERRDLGVEAPQIHAADVTEQQPIHSGLDLRAAPAEKATSGQLTWCRSARRGAWRAGQGERASPGAHRSRPRASACDPPPGRIR